MAKNLELTTEELIVQDPAEEQLERIRQRAHELYMARGQEDGHDLEDWLQAEAVVRAASAGN